jgi:hypothetical protein
VSEYLVQFVLPVAAVTAIGIAVWYLIIRAGSAMDEEFQMACMSQEDLDRLQRYIRQVKERVPFSLSAAKDFRDLAIRFRGGARCEPDRSTRDILVFVATTIEETVESSDGAE